MKIISHRGNLNGKNPQLENSIEYLEFALQCNFDVEIDFWKIDDCFFLGHDLPQYNVQFNWILKYSDKVWIHCKNIDALVYLSEIFKSSPSLNFFWHENDTVTLTSLGYIWAYPGKQPISGSVAVLPEIYDDVTFGCASICTDFPIKYKNNGFI